MHSNRWLAEGFHPWIPSLGVGFHLAMDGLSLMMVLLTAFLGSCPWSPHGTPCGKGPGSIISISCWCWPGSRACSWRWISSCCISSGN